MRIIQAASRLESCHDPVHPFHPALRRLLLTQYVVVAVSLTCACCCAWLTHAATEVPLASLLAAPLSPPCATPMVQAKTP